MSTPLYHFTCDHGRADIGDEGYVKPLRMLLDPERLAQIPETYAWLRGLCWFTDLGYPNRGATRGALGLTSDRLSCDRMAHRYRVLPSTAVVRPWLTVVRRMPRTAWELTGNPETLPGHWYVAEEPVPVRLDELTK